MIPLMFMTFIPEENYKPRTKRKIITEAEYYLKDRDKLAGFECPICKEHQLFRGCVYIGCSACVNFFKEKEIIEANI